MAERTGRTEGASFGVEIGSTDVCVCDVDRADEEVGQLEDNINVEIKEVVLTGIQLVPPLLFQVRLDIEVDLMKVGFDPFIDHHGRHVAPGLRCTACRLALDPSRLVGIWSDTSVIHSIFSIPIHYCCCCRQG